MFEVDSFHPISRAAVFFAVVAALCVPAVAQDSPEYFSVPFQVDGSPLTLQMSAWVPQDVPLKGMLLSAPGFGNDSRDSLADPYLQGMAGALGMGIMGLDDPGYNTPAYYYCGTSPAEASANLQVALDATASAFSTPEVSNAPVAFYGFSRGAFVANVFAGLVPDRAMCFYTDKGGSGMPSGDPAVLTIPGMFVPGSQDSIVSPEIVYGSYDNWRSQGAQVSLAVDWWEGHTSKQSDMLFTFLQQVMNERYPQGQVLSSEPNTPLQLATIPDNEGWLGQPAGLLGGSPVHVAEPEIAPYDDYSGDPNGASWFTNEAMARVWRVANDTFNGASEVTMDTGGWSHELGAAIDVSFELTGRRASIIDYVEIYHNEELLDTITITDPSGQVFYTPTTKGVHTFSAVAGIDSLPTIKYTDCMAVAVVPEPAMLALLGGGALAVLRRRRKA